MDEEMTDDRTVESPAKATESTRKQVIASSAWCLQGSSDAGSAQMRRDRAARS
jgi:hypothetical protein